jgi:Ca-activated chloride channel family protein
MGSDRRLGLVALATLGLLATTAAGGPAVGVARAETSRAVLVLDASGSMWGRVDGRPKIEIARDVIRDLMVDWDDRVELGLVAYGHRSRHDCDDIETLVETGPPDAARVLAAAEALRPIGMTPIGAAVRHAAEQLRYRETRATVVLVSDGQETCGIDPCALARELEAAGVDFTTHVIGFDVTREERAGLACLAEATGGRFLTADDPTGLLDALRAAMREVAARADALLWLSAALGPERTPLEADVAWRIARIDPRSGRAQAPVVERVAGSLTPKLEAGRYRIEARYDGVSATLELDYDPSVRERRVIELDAGQVALRATGPGDAPLAHDVVWRAWEAGGTEPVRESREASTRITLPAGRYRIEALHAGASITEDITLRAGRSQTVTARFGTGRLALRAVLAGGGAPVADPVHWTVRPAGGGGPVVEAEQPTTLHTLPTGRYRVSARYGDAVATGDVMVQPARTTTHTVDLHAGHARLFAAHPPPGGPILEPIDWRIERLDAGGAPEGADRPVERRFASEDVVLSAGRYRVSGHFGDLSGSREFEIRPGGRASVQVTFR